MSGRDQAAGAGRTTRALLRPVVNKGQVRPMEPMHRASTHPDPVDWETKVLITWCWDFSLGLWILVDLCYILSPPPEGWAVWDS